MRVLGIDVDKADICWIIMDGDSSKATINNLALNALEFPKAGLLEVENLIALKNLLEQQLPALNLDFIGIVRAGTDSSAIRAKVETMVQLAAHACGITCCLIAPQTITAAQKRKVREVAGGDFSQVFGVPKPKYLARAALCAWCVLNGSRG